MPVSFPEGKPQAIRWILCQLDGDAEILDVGPGAGMWGKLLKDVGYRNVDALEIFEPYVERFKLKDIYRNVRVGDVRTHEPVDRYKVVILGDVLEHMTVQDAKFVLAKTAKSHVIVSVPWSMPQGESEGNVYEAHLQDDLTPAVMAARYPELVSIHAGPNAGTYGRRAGA